MSSTFLARRFPYECQPFRLLRGTSKVRDVEVGASWTRRNAAPRYINQTRSKGGGLSAALRVFRLRRLHQPIKVDLNSTAPNSTAVADFSVPMSNSSLAMGRTSSNRTSSSLLNLALAAFYLNLTFKSADGSHFYQVGPIVPYQLPPFETPAVVPWPDSFGRYSQAGAQGYQGYGDNYRGAGGFRDGNGYYDDLMSSRNAYDIGKAYGGGQDYSKGAVVGGGYRDLSGRNKGHQAAGFSTSYRKDESGDQSTYYDDGLGHNARINYAAQDARYRDQGGAAKRGGYHDTNLNRNAIGNTGRYGDAYTYKGSDGGSHGYSGGSGYGANKGYAGFGYAAPRQSFSGYPASFSGYKAPGYHRGGRLLPTPAPNDTLMPLGPPPLPGPPGTTIKDTGIYVIPMPDKLYFDPVPDF